MMKSRLLDVMGDALALIRKSHLAEATTLLRAAVSDGGAKRHSNDRGDPSQFPPDSDNGPATRRPLGEVLQALRAGRAILPRTNVPAAEKPRYPSDDKFTPRTYRGDAGSLNYRLYIPAASVRRDPALVLMLHGCTQNPEDFALGTRMNLLADEFGLIVAYPHQPMSANASGCWNWFDKRHQRRGSGEPAKLAGLAQALADEFSVKKERVFAAGLSAGGAMADVLAATYPDVFDAVGIHSGLPHKAAHDMPSAFAAMKGNAASGPAPTYHRRNRAAEKSFSTGARTRPCIPRMRNKSSTAPATARECRNTTDMEWDIDGRRVNRRVLQRLPKGVGLSSNGSSTAARTRGSAETLAAPTPRASAWTLRASWCGSF